MALGSCMTAGRSAALSHFTCDAASLQTRLAGWRETSGRQHLPASRSETAPLSGGRDASFDEVGRVSIYLVGLAQARMLSHQWRSTTSTRRREAGANEWRDSGREGRAERLRSTTGPT